MTELLAAHEPRAERHPITPDEVAYHDACHLAHAQAVRAQPRELLSQIPGSSCVEPDGWEICCGSAGVYNLLEPEAADELGRRKVENLLATGAEAIAAGNPGCAIQIAAKSDAMGRPLRVYHPLELIHMSIQGGSPDGTPSTDVRSRARRGPYGRGADRRRAGVRGGSAAPLRGHAPRPASPARGAHGRARGRRGARLPRARRSLCARATGACPHRRPTSRTGAWRSPARPSGRW